MHSPVTPKTGWRAGHALREAIAQTVSLCIMVACASLLGTVVPGQTAVAQSTQILHAAAAPSPHQTEPALSKGKFLIATENVRGSLFSETVILLIDYSEGGGMGLIINRPAEERLSNLLPDVEGLKERPDMVYFGGPVSINQMFLLIRSGVQPGESVPVFADVYVSSSRTTLEQMLGGSREGDRFRVYAGYAGWAPQQLDQEVARGDWHVLQADAETIFTREPSAIWPELNRRSSMLWVRAPEVGGGARYVP